MFCTHKNCKSSKFALGYCRKHYQQFKKHGKTFEYTKWDFNEVIDKDSYYELILTDIKMNEVGRAKIDKEDLEKVKKVGRWCLTDDFYVRNKHSSIFMHRLVMNAKSTDLVDHIETGEKYRSDNRKKNLRICTGSQNQYNSVVPKNNTSGCKGVSWHKPSSKWRSRIKVENKEIYLGTFNSLEEAKRVYEKAARKYHKEFARF